MAKKPKRWTRREFLRDAALTAGAVGAASLLPPALPGLTARAQAQEAKLGAQLIGKLEGPELVLDPAKWPKKFAEAPMLADLVKQGKLPPVDKRVPDEPMVVKPLQSIGRYGGTWRRGFTGPGDGENGNRIVSTDKILFWDYTGTKIMPCVAREWKQSDDGKSVTISLRKGQKWSDGTPFTANDFVFWHDEVYLNKDLMPTPHPDFMAGSRSGSLRKIDDTTVIFEFQDPNFLFVDILAGSTAIGGGQATQSMDKRSMGAYMPAHYVKQFLPKFSSKDEVDRKAKAAGFDGWVSYIKNRWDWRLNPELPVLTPWKTVNPINTPTWVLERNPYYMGVDTQGNQLPYIDRISMTLAENLEVLNLRAIAGQYDLQERHTGLAKLPVFLENRAKGGYDVRLDPALNGSDATLQTNQAYDADPEVAKWLHTRDFRRALAMGIDRDQLNETFWVGAAGAFVPHTQIAEMIKEQWKKIGVQADVKEMERSLFFTRIASNEHQIALWANDGSEVLYLFPRHALPLDPVEALLGTPIARWYASNGAQGKAPKDAQMVKALELFRSAAGKKTQERYKVAQDIWKILVDEQWSIGTVGLSPATMGVRIVSNKLGNIPARQTNAQHARTPCSSHPATFFYKA